MGQGAFGVMCRRKFVAGRSEKGRHGTGAAVAVFPTQVSPTAATRRRRVVVMVVASGTSSRGPAGGRTKRGNTPSSARYPVPSLILPLPPRRHGYRECFNQYPSNRRHELAVRGRVELCVAENVVDRAHGVQALPAREEGTEQGHEEFA